MKHAESTAAKKLRYIYSMGNSMGWKAVAGDSVSNWLTSQELMEMEADLNWDGTQRPIGIAVPELARECFMFACQNNIRYDTGADKIEPSLMVMQVSSGGDMYRILWENIPDDHPLLEIALHFASHNARKLGAGSVVYHCQPLNVMALASLTQEKNGVLMQELVKGYAAVGNMLSDGVATVKWGMVSSIRRGMSMTNEMITEMRSFIADVGKEVAMHEVVAIVGEGIICASSSENVVISTISAVEKAAEIRLKMLAAGSL